MNGSVASTAPYGAPIERYSGDPRLEEIWLTKQGSGKFPRIHLVEAAVAAVLASREEISQDSAECIREATFDIERVLAAGGHDINAYLTEVRKELPPEFRGDLHRGLTAYDVQDTALALMYVESADILIEDLQALRLEVLRLAADHTDTLMIGRTHGNHGKPITFAFKLLVWIGYIDRAIIRLESARETIGVGKISGAVGVYTISPEVEDGVCTELDLEPAPISTQILPRDLHADFFHAITSVATACEYIATEIRNHHRTELREFMEPFPPGAKGSSAMPHKQNPEKCEMVCGLARVVRNDMGAIYENVTTWHERSLEQSSVERLEHPEMIVLTGHMVVTLTEVVKDLQVFPEKMLRNMAMTNGAIYSEAVQLLLRKNGVDPEIAYRSVQSAAFNALDGAGDLKTNILADPQVGEKTTSEELDEVMNPWRELQHIDVIYRRFGIFPKRRK